MNHKLFLPVVLFIFSIISVHAQVFNTGLKLPGKEVLKSIQNRQQRFYGAGADLDRKLLKGAYGDAAAIAFDLRNLNGVTSIKDQKQCGSCWAFASAACIESNYKLINKEETDISEQAILGCSGAGSCLGGWYGDVYHWLIGNPRAFLADETHSPYQQNNVCTEAGSKLGIKVINYGFADANNDGVASNEEIKDAIVRHGAVSAAVFASNDAFMNYKGQGVIKTPNSAADHAISIIGWDDNKNAWLIKNSWGELYWGDKGYGWLDYGYSPQAVTWVEVAMEDKPAPQPENNKNYFFVKDQLGESQIYQQVFLIVDDKEHYSFTMNKQNAAYKFAYDIEPGRHKIEIVTKSLTRNKNETLLIYGVGKASTVNIENKDVIEFKYDKLIERNVFKLLLTKK